MFGPSKNIPSGIDKQSVLEATYLQKAKEVVANSASSFGNNEKQTLRSIGTATSSITNMLKDLYSNGMSKEDVTNEAKVMFLELFEAIENSGSNFDFSKSEGIYRGSGVINAGGLSEGIDLAMSVANQGDKAKEDAMIYIISEIQNAKGVPADIKNELSTALSQKAYDFASKQGTSGYSLLTKQGSWKYLKQ